MFLTGDFFADAEVGNMSTLQSLTALSENGSPSSSEEASISEGVWKILIRSNVGQQRLKELLVPYFVRERILEVSDLEYVEEEDLRGETGGLALLI